MADQEDLSDSLSCHGERFFTELENDLRTEIPLLLKNVLLVMDVDRAVILSTFDDSSINEIEQYMRRDFKANDMLRPNDELKNYLGKYVDRPKDFALSYGHKLMVNAMVQGSRRMAKANDGASNPNTVPINSNQTGGSVVEQMGHGTFTQESALESKESCIEALFVSLNRWISGHPALSQIRLDELSFKVIRDSYKLRDNDTIECTIKCPVETCHETFCVSYKRYKSSYKPKKKPAEKQRALPPRWYIYVVEIHLLKHHTGDHPINEHPVEDSSRAVNSTGSHSPHQGPNRQLTPPPQPPVAIDNNTIATQSMEESSSVVNSRQNMSLRKRLISNSTKTGHTPRKVRKM